MRIDVTRTSVAGGITEAVTSHKGEELSWDVSMHDRSKIANKELMVKHINGFFESLPMETQDALWACYTKIYEVLQKVHEYESLVTVLQNQIKKFFKIATPAQFAEWLSLKGNVGNPSTVLESYEPNSKYSGIDRFQERTCLRSDYREILVLSLGLHAMLPIFGQFIARTEKLVGVNYKEQKTLPLITESDLFKTRAVEWLTNYIEATLAKVPKSDSAIIGGLATVDVPDWLLAKVLIRKLPIEEFPVNGDDNNIIIKIYHAVNNGLTGRDRNFLGTVTEKNRDRTGDSEKDRSSHAEKYKVKTETSIGDREPDGVYLENYVNAALRLDPEVNVDMVEDCVAAVLKLGSEQMLEHAVVMMQWVLAPVITPLSLPLLDAQIQMRGIGVTQALLWHWGYHDLAALMTATPVAQGREAGHVPLEGRSRIPREQIEELTSIFPHQQLFKGRAQSTRKTNHGCIAVDDYSDLVTGSEWTLNCPPELAAKIVKISTRRMLAPADLKAQLANLIINKVSQRS